MENQQSPATDQDVIDWLLENIIEQSRTRRSVIKKLKDLGLIFKAPTKRSNVAAASKNLFTRDEDERLRELYDEHRLEKNSLKKIMEVFDKKRSKNAVVKRMVDLRLIADSSEILPAKKPRNRKEKEQNPSGSSSESDDDEARTSTNYTINQREAAALRRELEESQKEGIEWIIESLNEAADDFEEASDEVDDAIPVVPFTESQRAAVEDPQFQKLLTALNFIVPKDRESYWKIPANMSPEELRVRVKLLAGEEVPEVEQVQVLSDDEDDDEDLFSRLRKQRDALIYNDEDKAATAPKKKTEKFKETSPEVMEVSAEAEESSENEESFNKSPKKVVEPSKINEESSDDDSVQQNIIKRKKKPATQQYSDELHINTQEIKKRLAELSDSSDDDNDKSTTHKKSKNVLDSSDDEEVLVIQEKRKSGKRDRSQLEDEGEEANENEMNATNNLKRIRRIADSSDDE